FVLEHSGAMPFFAELTTATEARLRKHTPILCPVSGQRRERGRQAQIKPSITGQVGGTVAVKLQPLLVNKEHRDTGLVLGLVPDLFDLDLIACQRHPYPGPFLLLSCRDMIAVNRRWLGKRREGIKRFVSRPAPVHPACSTQRRKLDLADELTGRI